MNTTSHTCRVPGCETEIRGVASLCPRCEDLIRPTVLLRLAELERTPPANGRAWPQADYLAARAFACAEAALALPGYDPETVEALLTEASTFDAGEVKRLLG